MRHRSLAAILAAITATFMLTSAALAGGWANAVLDDSGDVGPPSAGEPVTIGFTLLQHGVTPVDWGDPTITIINAATGEERSFAAEQRGPTGHWVAQVTYPSNGTWRVSVNHELEIALTGFRPVTIGPAPAAAAAQPAQTATSSAASSLLQPIAAATFALAILSAVGLLGLAAYRRRAALRRVSA
jgi:hypothetical protein